MLNAKVANAVCSLFKYLRNRFRTLVRIKFLHLNICHSIHYIKKPIII